MPNHYDIVLLAIPYANIQMPPLGVSVLSGVVKAHNFSCMSIDLAMELSKTCAQQNKDFESVQVNLMNPTVINLDPAIDQTFDYWVSRIAEWNPKFVGISVFSYFMHFTAWYLCQKLRQVAPKTKIILGGSGVQTPISQEIVSTIEATTGQRMISFGDVMKIKKLADYVVVGDGEQALLDILSSGTLNDDAYQLVDYKNEFSYANFDDLNLFDYQGQLFKGYPQLPVFTSKGCVRNCDFCDVNAVQQRFRFRQGKNIVKELLYLAERYGIREFNFADSLINGNLKSMIEWVTELAEYNRANPNKRITWSASWICRPIGQIKEHVYQLLAESGCENLAVGTESGSNAVLDAMDKKTSVEAMYYEIEQFRKNGIKFMSLLIVGHWAEHWDDFLLTAHMIYKLKDYVKSGHCIAIATGATLEMVPGTPMQLNKNKNQIESVASMTWWTSLNPNLTAKERYFRLLLLEDFCKKLNVPLLARSLPYVHKVLSDNIDSMKEFYLSKTKNVNSFDQRAEYYYYHLNQFIEEIESQYLKEYVDIKLELISTSVNGDPTIDIQFNGAELINTTLSEGTHLFEFKNLSILNKNKISLTMTGKSPMDTTVDLQGNIIKDKSILIKKFIVNNIDLVTDIEFFQNFATFDVNNMQEIPKFGLWSNHTTIAIPFDQDFESYYHRHSKKNSELGANILAQTTMHTTIDDEHYRKEILKLLEQFQR